jgi:hypothetical protein
MLMRRLSTTKVKYLDPKDLINVVEMQLLPRGSITTILIKGQHNLARRCAMPHLNLRFASCPSS